MKLFAFLFFLLSFIPFCISQDQIIKRDVPREHLWIQVDKTNGDSIIHNVVTNRYIKKSVDNILLMEGSKVGGFGSDCGCEPEKHGYFIERFRDGNTKEQGNYFCNVKLGNWIYFHENGQISKIENLVKPYPTPFDKFVNNTNKFKNIFLRNGPYLEFYPNGKLKTKGSYDIIEEFTTTDTIVTIDYNTYEEIYEISIGEFWFPKSIKSGNWYYYSENGELNRIEENKLNFLDDLSHRRIEDRLFESIKNLIEIQK